MIIQGRISNNEDPLNISLRGMTEQFYLMNYYADNIAYSDTPGYQRKVPVITTFAEELGFRGVDSATDTNVGRIYNTGKPLDLALNTKGYFQKLQSDGRVELTRDGRFRIDKNGNLLSDDNLPILSRQGTPIKFSCIPDDLKNIKVKPDGWIEVNNAQSGQSMQVAQLGVASLTGEQSQDVQVRQGTVEHSNVFLHEEFVGMVIPRRNFQANRQIFLTQTQVLNSLIQKLGSAQ